MNEEQLNYLKKHVTSMAESIMHAIQYYGDKGPNMEWKETYGDSNKVFITWQEEQWKNCLNAIDGLSNNGESIITYIRDLHEYIIDRSKIKQLEDQLAEVNKKTEKYEAAQITAEKNVIDEIHALRRDFLDQQKLSIEAQNLKQERDCLRDELIRQQEACVEAQNRAEQMEEELDNVNRETAACNAAHAAKEEEYRTEIARLKVLHEEKLKKQQRNYEIELKQEYDKLNTLCKEQVSCKEKDLQQVKEVLNEQIAKIQIEKNELGAKLDKTQRLFEQSSIECENAKQRYMESIELYELYRPVLTALQACTVFCPIVEKYLLEGSGIKPLFALARQIGVSIDFAKELYDMAKDAKKQNAETITDGERRVYEALNQCYRSLWKVDFDIYRQPGHQAITEDFQKVKYDTSESENLANSRDRNSKYAQEVYVPSLWARTGNVYFKALVKAGNL